MILAVKVKTYPRNNGWWYNNTSSEGENIPKK